MLSLYIFISLELSTACIVRILRLYFRFFLLFRVLFCLYMFLFVFFLVFTKYICLCGDFTATLLAFGYLPTDIRKKANKLIP